MPCRMGVPSLHLEGDLHEDVGVDLQELLGQVVTVELRANSSSRSTDHHDLQNNILSLSLVAFRVFFVLFL